MEPLNVKAMHRQKTACLIFGFSCLLKLVQPCYFEDEYCVLKCDDGLSKSEDKGSTITWHKRDFNTSEKVSVNTDSRILVNGNKLEFWPVSLYDYGEYTCTVKGKDYAVKSLNVKKKNPNYCIEVLSADLLIKTMGTSATIKCNLPDRYKNTSCSAVWYKDCKLYAENISEISFKELKVSDSAVYTYVITHMHNGQYYNISGKTKLTVTVNKWKTNLKAEEHVIPKMTGSESIIYKDVEMEQNVTVTCNASVGNTQIFQFSWVHNKSEVDNLDDLIEDCTFPITKTCMTESIHSIEEGIAYTKLIIPSINKDDIKYPYICSLTNSYKPDKKIFIFRLKGKKPDIPESVFKTSIIASVTCTFAIIFLFIICIIFRIEIVLLYRNITGLDETTGDSKEYDAYISFESYTSLQDDERDFALHTLAPVLEDCFGFKLCIFERDVTPGGAMVDDMNAFLEKSRRLIIVLSKNYTSDKAMYELESGLHKAMVERNIKLILIEFTPLTELSFVPESLQLLKTTNKVKWKGDKSRPLNSTFWKKMQYLMPAKPTLSKRNFQKQKKIQTSRKHKHLSEVLTEDCMNKKNTK